MYMKLCIKHPERRPRPTTPKSLISKGDRSDFSNAVFIQKGTQTHRGMQEVFYTQPVLLQVGISGSSTGRDSSAPAAHADVQNSGRTAA